MQNLPGPELAPIEPANKRERELRDRAVRDYAALQAVGLDTSRTFFAPGTEVGGDGSWEGLKKFTNGKIRAARREVNGLPIAHEGLDQLVETVLAEDRQDLPVCVGGFSHQAKEKELPHLSTGMLGGWNIDSGKSMLHMGPTERAWGQLISKRPAGHAAAPQDVCAWLSDVDPHEVVVRHRKMPATRESAFPLGAREAYAMVSPSYQPYDLNEAAADLRKVVPADARCRVRYDGQRATVDIILQNPYRLDGEDVAAVGETHRVILRMRTADDGSGGYHLSLLAERVRCVNLTLLHAKRSLFHGTHRQQGLRDLAEQALQAIEPTMEQFAATWRDAWQDYWVDRYTKGRLSGEEAIKRIVGHGKFRVSGLGAEGTLAACLSALNEEPGDTRAHVHNALTRAAHMSPTSWVTRWSDEEAEEEASKLLYQHVYTLNELDEAVS